MCVSHLRSLLRGRVKEKKGLLVAYHVLHDDGAAVMNSERFAEFVKHLPRVNVRAVPHCLTVGALVMELAHALLADRGSLAIRPPCLASHPRRTTPASCSVSWTGLATAPSLCASSFSSSL